MFVVRSYPAIIVKNNGAHAKQIGTAVAERVPLWVVQAPYFYIANIHLLPSCNLISIYF